MCSIFRHIRSLFHSLTHSLIHHSLTILSHTHCLYLYLYVYLHLSGFCYAHGARSYVVSRMFSLFLLVGWVVPDQSRPIEKSAIFEPLYTTFLILTSTASFS